VNTKLLDLVAEQTRGYSQYVLPNENLELSMSNFWGKVQDPVLAGLKLESGDIRLTNRYPNDLPDLFKGDQLVAFGTYDKPGKTAVVLTGRANGQEQRFAQDVTFEEKTDGSREWIAKLWATRRVGYLLDQIRTRGESKEVRDEVVELARRWGVVTPYTAMLIIEDERRRNVPLADRSMREMEFDQRAARNSAAAVDSLRRQESVGGQAVANSVNSNAYKQASNLQDADQGARQSTERLRAGQDGAALSKAEGVASAGPAASPAAGGFGVGGGAGGAGGGRGGRGGGGGRGRGGLGGVPAPGQPSIDQKDLNLGTATASGWQVQTDPTKDTGYRSISNYAQQTRVINNRSFFLNGNQWTDVQIQNLKSPTRVKIAFGSDAYFGLLTKYPEAAQYLSLGNNVTLELGGTVYDIVEEESPTK
jgi:hypothetical protein